MDKVAYWVIAGALMIGLILTLRDCNEKIQTLQQELTTCKEKK